MGDLSFSGTLKESDLGKSALPASLGSRQSSYRESDSFHYSGSFLFGGSFKRQGSVAGESFRRQGSFADFPLGSRQSSYRERPGDQSFRQRSYRARDGALLSRQYTTKEELEMEITGHRGIPEDRLDGGDGDPDSTDDQKQELLHPVESVPFYKLFKYADHYDILLMLLGTLGAIGNGLVSPLIILIQSQLVNKFGTLSASDASRISGVIAKFVLYMVYIGLGGWFGSYLELSCWMKTGERQSSRIRALYLRAILRQNIGFFDTAETGSAALVASIGGDSLVLQDAMSEKVGNFIATFTQFLGGYVVGFYLSWLLTVIAIFMTPLLLLPGLFYKYALTDLAVKRHLAYDKASMIAEQAITSIRTVYSYAGEKEVVKKYIASLDATVEMGKKQGFFKGFAVGATGFGFIIWGVLAWVGSILIINGSRNGGQVLMTGFAILIGGMALGQLAPTLRAFSEGAVAGHRMFSMIDRVPSIDSDDSKGEVLDGIKGHLELRHVDFTYPARPEAPIFQDFSLDIPAGKSVALVGASGSGKSTVIALLERFYDPQEGVILVDGVDIKRLQLKWLRRQIGLVSQEPALFATSIKENILYGKENASMEEVIAAAKAANAHDFITNSPEGYDTQVGERGAQLSGGQKQRIAIARAVLKDPKVLLLDEATSALDAESERIVQEALEMASKGRTTVTVAHRLSTIQNADVIAVVHQGKVVELGKHSELLLRGETGAYAALVRLQAARNKEEEQQALSRSASLASSRSSSVALRDSHALSRGLSRNSSRNSSRRLSFSRSLKRSFRIGDDAQGDYETLIIDIDAMVPEEEYEDRDAPPKPSFWRLIKLNGDEWKEGVLGVIGAVGFGFVQPTFAVLIGGIIQSFYTARAGVTDEERRHNHDNLRAEVRNYFGVFVGLTCLSLLVNVMQHYFFAAMGEKLTKKIRSEMLTKLLQFEVGWFDLDRNSSGAVCSRLNNDANQVRSLVGDRISLLVQTASSILVSFILGLIISWRLAVVLIAIQPLMIFCYSAKKIFLGRFAAEAAQGQADASQVAAEAVGQLRTVAAYSAQDKILDLFDKKLEVPRKQINKKSQIAGVGLGAAVFIMYASWALAYWYGGKLLSNRQVSFADFFRTFFVLVSSGRILAEAGNLSPDLARGSQAVASVFEILDRNTQIDADDEKGDKPSKISGVIELINVDFAYPSRPYVMVFKKFNLKIRQGKTVAMVGHSGSGKSTIIGLIERFYDPLNGRVLIDNQDIKSYNLRALRKSIGLVSQEPTLFAATIRENIAYGTDGATETEIIGASKSANAHTFISGLPDGYDTYCGERGLQLSGGQKQRIAIARAMLKNPAILLLDEATSALDAESERVVQDALDKMMKGRTTVVVAHRLATIQNADTIAVIQDGAIVEKGTHKELLAKGESGSYFSLVQIQNRRGA